MIKVSYDLDFGDLNDFFYNLLIEEDFDFKNRNIFVSIQKKEKINLNIEVESILDLKISTNAIIKSLEIIEKVNNL